MTNLILNSKSYFELKTLFWKLLFSTFSYLFFYQSSTLLQNLIPSYSPSFLCLIPFLSRQFMLNTPNSIPPASESIHYKTKATKLSNSKLNRSFIFILTVFKALFEWYSIKIIIFFKKLIRYRFIDYFQSKIFLLVLSKVCSFFVLGKMKFSEKK